MIRLHEGQKVTTVEGERCTIIDFYEDEKPNVPRMAILRRYHDRAKIFRLETDLTPLAQPTASSVPR